MFPRNDNRHMTRFSRYRIDPAHYDEPSVVRHALSFFARFQPHPFVRMGAPMLDHIVGPHTVQMLSVVDSILKTKLTPTLHLATVLPDNLITSSTASSAAS